jgi:hypothetical protein
MFGHSIFTQAATLLKQRSPENGRMKSALLHLTKRGPLLPAQVTTHGTQLEREKNQIQNLHVELRLKLEFQVSEEYTKIILTL